MSKPKKSDIAMVNLFFTQEEINEAVNEYNEYKVKPKKPIVNMDNPPIMKDETVHTVESTYHPPVYEPEPEPVDVYPIKTKAKTIDKNGKIKQGHSISAREAVSWIIASNFGVILVLKLLNLLRF